MFIVNDEQWLAWNVFSDSWTENWLCWRCFDWFRCWFYRTNCTIYFFFYCIPFFSLFTFWFQLKFRNDLNCDENTECLKKSDFSINFIVGINKNDSIFDDNIILNNEKKVFFCFQQISIRKSEYFTSGRSLSSVGIASIALSVSMPPTILKWISAFVNRYNTIALNSVRFKPSENSMFSVETFAWAKCEETKTT